ncbi:MAG: Obg family GTPase CgtA, partial [Candidatus Limnocylindria bacterium]
SELRFTRTVAGGDGGHGAGRDRRGKSGREVVVRVPAGTVVRDEASGAAVADLVADGDELIVARGGRGGKGNARFASSTNRVPRIAEDGQLGERREIELELKLLADVGLVGLPNAGKSTLLAALTRARPKIAAYPFTTLTPNLGVTRLEERELVVADIPGLIAGASHGAGLGEEFLRHIERTRVLVHVVDASLPDPLTDIATIETELAAHGSGLLDRPGILALNKTDLAEAREAIPALERGLAGREAVAVSAASGDGIDRLRSRIFAACPPRPRQAAAAPERRIAFADSGRSWSVIRDGDAFRVRGDRIERLAGGIDWQSPEAAAYFQRVLERSGVRRELRTIGVRDGDTVRIGKVELEWRETGEGP